MSSNRPQDKLNRYRDLIVGKTTPAAKERAPKRYLKLAEFLGGAVETNHAGNYCLVKETYPRNHQHGNMTDNFYAPDLSWPRAAFTSAEEAGRVDLSSLLFIDTETTGLGGSGAVAFLVGCGSVVEEGFEVRQYLIPDYSDEAALLEGLLAEFGAEKTLVSYNGAAFDLPLLRSRMIINRVARHIDHDFHIDLLHPSRRLFRRRLGDCTLTNLERELFQFHRADDIPGYLIPSVYFDWLSGQTMEPLGMVLEHNRLDILSLYYLVNLVAEAFQSEGETLTEVDDLHSLSRLYGRRRQTDKVQDCYRRIDNLADRCLPEDIVLFHSLNFKRVGDLSQAVVLWQQLSESRSREGFLANLELAKYFEHRARDFQQALECTRRAEQLYAPSAGTRIALHRRLSRLQRRLTD
jgi:uncharacterized protein YprB with RNaseH-like and TPR domain